jgi:hypothetical protein
MPDVIIKPLQGTTITLQQAILETTNWRNWIQPHMNDHVIRAFYIPIQDIIELAKMHEGIEGVRAYLMLPDPQQIATVKVAIVPVTKDGKDVLRKKSETSDEQSTIYDFTQPCPHLCDTDSELY